MPKLWTDTIASHRAAVRDAILDATEGLVDELGLRSVTMADVAIRAGIGRATLYKYFGDAESILRAWHEREVDRHLAGLVAITQGTGDAATRLRAVLEHYATTAHARRGAHDGELGAFLHRDERVFAARVRLRQLLADLIAEAAAFGAVRDDITPTELAAYCLAALSAAGEASTRTGVRRLIGLTLAGLRP
jgi:AcrR family transcriptional regulator